MHSLFVMSHIISVSRADEFAADVCYSRLMRIN